MKNVEIEIKFKIKDKETADAIAADPYFLEHSAAAGAEGSWDEIPVSATYFDTDNQDLQQADIAYRVRREGENLVATVKRGGNPKSNVQRRQEWNVEVNSMEPDVVAFRETEIGKELEAISGKDILQPRFLSVFNRRFITLCIEQDTCAELALDIGNIIAGKLSEPICELELELKQGNPQVMLALANQIAEKYGLSPEPRSKYSRGVALAQG